MASSKKPVDFDELYPGRFVKAGELGGRNVTLTMQDVDIEELEGEDGKKMKAIVTFRETKKQLVACKTNGICLREMFGRKVQEWIGKRVTLKPDVWNGEPCIRIAGSPDIAADMQVTIALPRRKPYQMTMTKTNPRHREPGED